MSDPENLQEVRQDTGCFFVMKSCRVEAFAVSGLLCEFTVNGLVQTP